MFGFLKYAVVAALMASPAAAVTIYDEAVNGEAGGPSAPTALGTLASGETSTVFGSDFEGIGFALDFSFVFGPSVDAYSFSVLADTTIDAGTPQGGNATDGLFLNLTGPVSAETAVSPGFTIGLLGVTLTPGDYVLLAGSAGLYDYQIDFNVAAVDAAVPLPATALLLLSGLAGLGLVSRCRTRGESPCAG